MDKSQVNVNTIKFYIDDTNRKIELLRIDIAAYQQHIIHDEKEIETLRWLINQYETALKSLDNEELEKNNQ